uniref:HEAT repeat domain-containing protein n=1 Tax=Anisakis simplex TaxID=6269 RepID=A0A0M3JBR1_ANISI
LSVRGLGDIAACRQSDLQKYSSQAIRAAMNGLDDSGDRRDEVAMEAINALNKLSTRVDNDQLESILSSVLLKLRPCFEKAMPAELQAPTGTTKPDRLSVGARMTIMDPNPRANPAKAER